MLAGENVTFLSEGEVEQIIGTRTSFTIERAQEERWRLDALTDPMTLNRIK